MQQRLNSADFKTLRKMEKCLKQCIKAEEKAKRLGITFDGLTQLLENTRELRRFFKLGLNAGFRVYAWEWRPVSRPLIMWAAKRIGDGPDVVDDSRGWGEVVMEALKARHKG